MNEVNENWKVPPLLRLCGVRLLLRYWSEGLAGNPVRVTREARIVEYSPSGEYVRVDPADELHSAWVPVQGLEIVDELPRLEGPGAQPGGMMLGPQVLNDSREALKALAKRVDKGGYDMEVDWGDGTLKAPPASKEKGGSS